MTTNSELFERAKKSIPGGVNSPVRSFRSVGGTPYFVARAEGAHVWDVEGRKYIDYVQSYGASILGHGDKRIVDAISEAAVKGTSYGAPTEREVQLAEKMCARVDGLEMVRLVNSGTEACQSAIRLARGATGRSKIIKFAGCYHGHADALLAAGGSGVANQGLADSAGVTSGAVADTIVCPYNVVPEIDFEVAAVIVEPVAANMGVVLPRPGFLEGLREACDKAGALFVFDEVITGFRVSPGGASQLFGVHPDLWCFGKVIGGGLPIGAFGGRRDVMEHLAPLGAVYQAGTLSGNPLATAAGLAVLDALDDEAYNMLDGRGAELQTLLLRTFDEVSIPVSMPRVGGLIGLFFAERDVRDFDDAKASADSGMYSKLFHELLARGIALAPGPYEAMFPSLAHSWDDIDHTYNLWSAAVAKIAS